MSMIGYYNRTAVWADKPLQMNIYQLKNEQAAKHLLDEIDNTYDHSDEKPLQFSLNTDIYLTNRGYHQLENYWRKL